MDVVLRSRWWSWGRICCAVVLVSCCFLVIFFSSDVEIVFPRVWFFSLRTSQRNFPGKGFPLMLLATTASQPARFSEGVPFAQKKGLHQQMISCKHDTTIACPWVQAYRCCSEDRRTKCLQWESCSVILPYYMCVYGYFCQPIESLL